MNTSTDIKKKFPLLVVKDFDKGANVHFTNGTVLTVWFKKRKYKTNKQKQWTIFEAITEVYNLISSIASPELKESPVEALWSSGFKTPEQTLDIVLGETSDSFDANYREDVIHAMEMYNLQFTRGIVKIPDDLPYPTTAHGNGVQLCIDHVKNKLELAKKLGKSNDLCAMLLNLSHEFEQYL